MIEVFKTDVDSEEQASKLLIQIHKNFKDYQANFDLEDCDNILRVECPSDYIQVALLIRLLKINKINAEVLEDQIPS